MEFKYSPSNSRFEVSYFLVTLLDVCLFNSTFYFMLSRNGASLVFLFLVKVQSKVVYLPMRPLQWSLSAPKDYSCLSALSQKHVKHETICCLQT